MDDNRWTPLVPWPAEVTTPVRIGEGGTTGLTAGRARGAGWVRTSHGMFVPRGVDRTIVEQRIVEQAARLPAGGAVTGWAALRLAGGRYFDGLAPDGFSTLPVQVVVPEGARLKPREGVVYTRRRLSDDDVRMVHGVPVARLLQAVVDEIRRASDEREATVVLDMALTAGFVTLAQVDRWLEGAAGHRAIKLVRRARQRAVDRSMSPRETRMRLVWTLDAGLPVPLCNWPVYLRNGAYLGRPDLLDPASGLYGEYDGRAHRSRAQHRKDVARHQAFERAGMRGFTLVAGDLDDQALAVTRMLDAWGRAQHDVRPHDWRHADRARPLWRR